jgi:hypothetical protein
MTPIERARLGRRSKGLHSKGETSSSARAPPLATVPQFNKTASARLHPHPHPFSVFLTRNSQILMYKGAGPAHPSRQEMTGSVGVVVALLAAAGAGFAAGYAIRKVNVKLL